MRRLKCFVLSDVQFNSNDVTYGRQELSVPNLGSDYSIGVIFIVVGK